MNYTNLTLPNFSDGGFGAFMRFANQQTDNLMGMILIVGIIIIVFLRQRGTYKQNVATAMLVGMFSTAMFFLMGIVTEYFTVVVIIIMTITLLLLLR